MTKFQGMTYPYWKEDYEILVEECRRKGNFRWIKLHLEKMKRKQRLFDGDRSHPEIVKLDALAKDLTYDGRQSDVTSAARMHTLAAYCEVPFIRHPMERIMAEMKSKQEKHNKVNMGKRKVKIRAKSAPTHTAETTKQSSSCADAVKSASGNIQDEEDEDDVCVICMEHNRTHALEPCGHAILCAHCSWSHEFHCQLELRCPFCRAACTGIKKIK